MKNITVLKAAYNRHQIQSSGGHQSGSNFLKIYCDFFQHFWTISFKIRVDLRFQQKLESGRESVGFKISYNLVKKYGLVKFARTVIRGVGHFHPGSTENYFAK